MPDEPAPPSEQSTLDQGASSSTSAFGRYRLLQRIGEGGMGEVWLAEQTEPVHRQVALKVIKAGMDSAQVVARFEAERQALAMMDHPAIATVFNGASCGAGCIDLANPACSCTTSLGYWSSTTYTGDPVLAWIVDFLDGYVYSDSKTFSYFVRAVRGGS